MTLALDRGSFAVVEVFLNCVQHPSKPHAKESSLVADRYVSTPYNAQKEIINFVWTYWSSSIWMAWYHPIPRLGAPHPTRITSACPSLAILTDLPAYERVAVLATAFLLTNPAVLRAARENIVAAIVVDFDEYFILCREMVGQLNLRRRISTRSSLLNRSDRYWYVQKDTKKDFCRWWLVLRGEN